MKINRWIAGAACALALWGCSGSGDGGSGGSTGGDQPVTHDPLAGTFDGSPWTAGVAVATPSPFGDGGQDDVTVYERSDAGCGSFNLDGRQLLTQIPWVAHSSLALGLTNNFTFAFPVPDGGFENLVATQGRIELDDAPTAPGDGGQASTTMRLRGAYDSDNTVEGQVPVVVCPAF